MAQAVGHVRWIMVMPPTIIAVATSRRASIPLLECHSRNAGDKRFRIMANMSTNIGRLLVIVDTRDTGPLCNAQNDSTIPAGANVSLKASNPIAEFLCFILSSCLTKRRRAENNKKMPDMQNVVSQNIFQNDM